MGKARVRELGNLDNLLRSEWENIILQAKLGKEDTYIATQYFLEAVPQIDISVELNIERSTISRRLPIILDKLNKTAQKMRLI